MAQEKLRVKVKNIDLMGVASSNEAFIASKITSQWQDAEEIYQTVKGFLKRDEFYAVINSFVEQGGVEKEVLKKPDSEYFSLNGTEDLRDYGAIVFDQRELNDAPDLPLNLKKEILFLYYYGNSLNFYKVLNLSKGVNSTDAEISYACNRYRQLLAVKNFIDIELGTYTNKVEKVRKILRKSFQLEDTSTKLKYDMFLKSQTDENGNKEHKIRKIEKTEKKSPEDIAMKHFFSAMKLFSEKEIEKAYNEIQIAIHLAPDNSEYKALKKEIDQAVEKEKINILIEAIEKDDSLIMDEKKLQKAVNKVLELTDSSPLMLIRIAESALEKEMPEMVIQYARKAADIDKDLEEKAETLIKKAEKLKKDFYIDQDEQKTFHIG